MPPAVSIEPMNVSFDRAVVEDLRARLRNTRPAAAHDDDWARGVPASWLGGVVADWQTFDIGRFQRRLAEFDHLRANIGGQVIHVLVDAGHGPDPLPLLLANGWPGSFCEYLDILPLLTDPGGHGGDPADAFTVVAPSLPGFGFSAPPPPGGLSAVRVADMWDRLMIEGLGHPRYVAHGSDLGAGVVAHLARSHPTSLAGIHLATPGLPQPPQPWTPAEAAYAEEVQAWSAEEGSYAHQHATKPATIGAALNDSPAGLAAWIGEKIVAWSSVGEDGQPSFPKDLLLGTLTVYWVTGTITSSMLPYWIYRHTQGAALPPDDPSPVPTAVSIFGGERVPFPRPPRELAEHFVNVSVWEQLDRGGHFPAAAEPALLAETLREVFRPLRRNI